MSFLLLPLLAACTEKETLRYGLQDQVVYEDKTQKTKRKSESEYISILYTNLYQQPITPNQLYKTQQVVQSIGDRTLAWEMLLSNYFNKPGIQMPDELSATATMPRSKWFSPLSQRATNTPFIDYPRTSRTI